MTPDERKKERVQIAQHAFWVALLEQSDVTLIGANITLLMEAVVSRLDDSPPPEGSVIEQIARTICIAENCDPDAISVGLGCIMPEGKRYLLWEARVPAAEAMISSITFIAWLTFIFGLCYIFDSAWPLLLLLTFNFQITEKS